MSIYQRPLSQDEAHIDSHFWQDQNTDLFLVEEGRPPSRIERARERMLVSRLYLGRNTQHLRRLWRRVCGA